MRDLLLKCAIFRAGNEALVICDTGNAFIEIVRRQREFIQTLNPRKRQEKIILKSNSGEKKPHSTPSPPRCRQKNNISAEKYPELNSADGSE